MFQCHVCNSNKSKQELTSEIFQINGKYYLVEKIPVEVCEHCGEEIFNHETTEEIRKMLNEAHQPIKTISVDVFSYPAAS